MVWTNQDIVLYHGTHSIAAEGIQREGFRLDLSRERIDFGRGVYTTTNERQALGWAARAAKNYKIKGAAEVEPVVLRASVRRLELAKQAILFFVRSDSDYWDFVTHCRGGRNHGHDWYDVVAGPLSKWPMPAVYPESDQISFHTETACRLL